MGLSKRLWAEDCSINGMDQDSIHLPFLDTLLLTCLRDCDPKILYDIIEETYHKPEPVCTRVSLDTLADGAGPARIPTSALAWLRSGRRTRSGHRGARCARERTW